MIRREINPCLIQKNGKQVWLVRVPKDLREGGGGMRFFGDDKRAATSFIKQLGEARQSAASEFLKLTPGEQSAVLCALRLIGADELLKAATHWNLQRPSAKRPVADVVLECIESKRQSGVRPNYIATLKCTLNNFAIANPKPIHEITADQVARWLNGNGWQPKTRLGYLKDVSTMFKFAIKRGIVTSNPTDGVDRPRLEHKPPQIFNASDCKTLLTTCQATDPALLGYICPILFGGVRPAESARMTPQDVRGDMIDLSGQKAKLRKRRVISMNDTLKSWLAVAGVQFGNINLAKRMRKLIKKTGLKWSHDVLRHTFCSNALPKYGARTTAELAGHSEQVLFAHYREIVSVEDSDRFWSLKP